MKFILRPWKQGDLKNLVRYANNYKIARNLSDKFPYPYTKQDGENFIAFATQKSTHYIFAIVINNEACGGIGLHPQDDIHCRNAELGYWLAEPYWGNGIISSAIQQIVVYGFEHLSNVDRIFARSFGSNLASQKVLEKTGFVLEAKFTKTLFKFGEYEDEWIYGLRRPS
ncbi:GNAT family N-acetyltransferase [Aquimarina sp. U1-2]|uniref:GNAT family N-acetyltransferase n=1 Tax=Aquimarina sp. U1-2 TaxID=2823141 RepID=UPI001AEC7C61|nr:GNAT family protein [Aquimarina sp. U1-2]MBP2832778.1 GNAT family N-acetyltransferase [Aquimarina sp. U1-2]